MAAGNNFFTTAQIQYQLTKTDIDRTLVQPGTVDYIACFTETEITVKGIFPNFEMAALWVLSVVGKGKSTLAGITQRICQKAQTKEQHSGRQ